MGREYVAMGLYKTRMAAGALFLEKKQIVPLLLNPLEGFWIFLHHPIILEDKTTQSPDILLHSGVFQSRYFKELTLTAAKKKKLFKEAPHSYL